MATPHLLASEIYVITKQAQVTNEGYEFCTKMHFLKQISDNCKILSQDNEFLELELVQGINACLYYANEFDSNQERVNGNLLIDVKYNLGDYKLLYEKVEELSLLLDAHFIKINFEQA